MSNDVTGRAEIRETWPFFIIVSVVLGMAYFSATRSVASLEDPLRMGMFTTLIVTVCVMYWLCPLFIASPQRRLAYLAILAGATFAIGLLTPGHWAVMGIYPALLGLGIGLFWPDTRAVGIAVILCLALLITNLAVGYGLRASLAQLPFIGLSFAFTLIYVVLFVRQVDARQRAQSLLADLEAAHRKLRQYATQVEQLTITRERERMGRELHDTLAQGLAGLIMQLEAIDAHLEVTDTPQARAVLHQAMERSRTTLHEARRAIQALRASVLEEEDLEEALRRETTAFFESTGLPCSYEAEVQTLDVSPEEAQDILRIVQESLSNVARHARATSASVLLQESHGQIRVTVADDGVGFDPAAAHDGFGLAGMHERAARLGGTLRVESTPGSGTTVELVTPGGGE